MMLKSEYKLVFIIYLLEILTFTKTAVYLVSHQLFLYLTVISLLSKLKISAVYNYLIVEY
jgi:hypothetical protein